MEPAFQLAARSLNGCWTCRVRKKKCDETRPVCRSCASFGLECHGYGPRPEWMDNGRLQKEQAAKFKHIVSQRKSTNRKQGLPRQARPPQDLNRSPGPRSNEDAPKHIASSTAERSFVAPSWSAPSHNDFPSTAPRTAPRSQGNDDAPQHPPALYRKIDSPQNSLSPESYSNPSWVAPDTIGVYDIEEVRTTIVPYDMGFAKSGRSNSIVGEWPWDLYSTGHALPKQTALNSCVAESLTAPGHAMAPGNYEKHMVTPETPMESVRPGESEDFLFMHYLNRVFYIQYPFYLSHDRRGKGCLFSILRMVKPAYLASLALGERDLLSIQSQEGDVTTNLARLRAKGGYYDRATQATQRLLRESHTWNRSAHMAHIIESLTSIHQLLFWELFAGGTGNWQVLLRQAAGLITGLLEARTPLANTKAPSAIYASLEETLSPGDHDAASVMLGSFVSLDIISSASTRRPPFLNIDHAQALQNPSVSLEGIMGCRNSVMALIFEISLLDRWKEESQAVHKLSIIDLAERGRRIEERLRQELVDTKTLTDTCPTLLSHSGVLSGPANPDVNRLFALAALIYLHVVISGAHPELPEIADAVSQAIAIYKGLWDRRMLQSVLVWPFCVSGCLALGEQQTFFRNLVTAAEITETTPGTCFEALKIMEECWETRKSGPRNCDWASIMKCRGYYLLLR
ncbi:putative C6 transcription factor [Aspergillus floccosus]